MTETFLPTSPGYFDNHQLLDVLDFYDGPKIYTFYTQSKDFYLAYFADDDGSCEEWLFIPTSESTVNRLVANEISIRNFFELSDISYIAKMNKGSAINVEKKYFPDLEQNYIPEDDVFLDCISTIISVQLIKEGISPRNTPESVVGNVVSHVRKLFKDTMRALREEDPSFHDCPSTPDFYYNGILAGSVSIILKPIRENLLIGKAAATIEKVVSESCAGLSEKVIEKIERSLIPLAPNSNSRLYGFDSIAFGGIYPTGSSQKKLSFTLTPQLRRKLQEKYGPTLMTNSVILTGIVDSGTASMEEFVLCNLEQNELQLADVKCRFDSGDIEIQGDIDEAAVWVFMKLSSLGKKLRVAGEYDPREKILTVQSIQTK